jgi:hypothetical protein
MKRLRWLVLYLVLLPSLGVCQSPPSETKLPYEAWRLGFLAPQNMDVWVETADVEDVQGRVFPRAGSGTVSMGYNPDSASWGGVIGWGAGKYVMGASLPKRIYVRWQSLVEPQTYSVTLDIPERARQQMLVHGLPPPDKSHEPWYYEAVAIGLAPGGIVRVWIVGPGLKAIPMMCVKAHIEPKGPFEGKSHGVYAYRRDELDVRAQAYLKTHSIPYGMWGCDAAHGQ